MNHRRGFFRLWLALSMLWVLTILALGSSIFTTVPFWRIWPAITDGWAAQRELGNPFRLELLRRQWAEGNDAPWIEADPRFGEAAIISRVKRGWRVSDGAVKLCWAAILPPSGLLALGLVSCWILRGFRSGPGERSDHRGKLREPK